MQLALNKFRVGAGIYVTNKRLVLTGVGGDLDIDFKKMVSGSGRKNFDPSTLTLEQNRAIVEELAIETPKQLVLRKEQVSSMEMKQPPGIFRTGYLRVLFTSGETLQLIIGKKREYEYILYLLQSFNPPGVETNSLGSHLIYWDYLGHVCDSSDEQIPALSAVNLCNLFSGLMIVLWDDR